MPNLPEPERILWPPIATGSAPGPCAARLAAAVLAAAGPPAPAAELAAAPAAAGPPASVAPMVVVLAGVPAFTAFFLAVDEQATELTRRVPTPTQIQLRFPT